MADTTATVVISISLNDEAAKGLGALGKKIKKTGDDADEAGKKTGRFGKGLSGLKSLSAGASKGLGALSAGLTAGAAAFTAAAAAGAVLIATTDKLLDAWGEQQAAVSGTASALSRVGLEGSALSAELERINGLASEMALSTMFGDEAIFEAVAQYTKLSGDARIETEQLDTILGIAAGTQKEAAEAAEIYAKAMKGDIGPLKDLTSLTAAQEEELNKLKGTSEQATLVNEILRAQYGGLAQEVDSTQNAIKNLSDAFGDTQQAMGGVISQSGVLAPIMDAITRAFRFVEAAVYDNSVQIQQWIVEAVLSAVDGVLEFNDVLIENSDFLAGVTTVAMLLGKVFGILTNTVMLIAQTIRTVLSTALAGITEGFAVLMDTAAEAAAFMGDRGMAASMRQAAAGARSLSDELAGDALKGVEGIKAEALAATEKFDSFGDIIASTEERAALARKGLELTRENIVKLRKELEVAQKNIKPVTATTVTTQRTSLPATTADSTAPLDELIAKNKQVKKQEEARLEVTLDIVRARQLEAEAAAALSITMRDIVDSLGGISTGVGEVDSLAASFVGLADSAELAKEAEQARHAATTAALFADEDAAESATAAKEQTIQAEMARAQAVAATGQAVASAAGALGASAQAEAAIQAAFNAAAAVAAGASLYVTGNPAFGVAAAQYALSAGMYAAVAGGVGGSTPSPSGASAGAPSGGASASPTAQTVNAEQVAQIQAQALADVLEERRSGDTVINVTVRDSLISNEEQAVGLFNRAARSSSLGRRLMTGA